MSKAAKKSKTFISNQRVLPKQISFNSDGFEFQGANVRTALLYKSTRNVIIQLYKRKIVKQITFSKKSLTQKKNSQEAIYPLLERQARQIIKQGYLKNIRRSYEKMQKQVFSSQRWQDEGVIQQQAENQSEQQVTDDIKTNKQTVSLMKTFNQIKKQGTQDEMILRNKIKELQIRKQIKLKKEALVSYIRRKCYEIQKDIFIHSIIFIIQIEKSDFQRGKYQNLIQQSQSDINSIVVFQQCFMPRVINKTRLIQTIGKQNYRNKIQTAISLYQNSQSLQNFDNPQYLSCHRCMKVLQNLDFPKNLPHCQIIVECSQKDIKPKFYYSPYQYYQKIIKKKFLQKIKYQQYTHPYFQYEYFNKKDERLVQCNRRWCGRCYLLQKNNKKNEKIQIEKDFAKCKFCSIDCKCFRCKMFFKLVQLQGVYLEFGGSIKDLENKFIFKQFLRQQNIFKLQNIGQGKRSYNALIKQMISKNNNEQYFLQKKDKIVQQNYYQQLITNIGNVQQFQKQLLHSDKRRKKIKHNSKQQKKRPNKHELKLTNHQQDEINLKIQNLSLDKKQIFKDLVQQEVNLLAKKMINKRIFLNTDPSRNLTKHQKQSISSLSYLAKSQIKFFNLTKNSIVDPTRNLLAYDRSKSYQQKVSEKRRQMAQSCQNQKGIKQNILQFKEKKNTYDYLWQ